MPTYAFSTAKELTAEQRAKLVESVTSIHQVEAAAPRYFVQVIFHKIEPGSMFIGGEAASPDHVWVRADIRSGRTNEQKANILRRVMRETSEILGIAEQAVWVYISDIPAQGVLEFGNVLPEPGGEEQWLASLPSALREKLMRSA
ncbi:4-oxalocrotonate tautomerase [Skermanella stibiiresistens SB22]|uniref:4-oxalocrotonate tautomerase n=1 Tax=Skermanella stibiiresistens SB22 TaxID=1385369 RepID=W9GWJ5_9PROT|nr:tautomerase family protein [Skermanella stibiiresistens]EWY38154.1 4-oxalocrotonate tautomerase [Skermanella stibiiresistens SB22]